MDRVFFPTFFIYGLRAKRAGHKNKEGKKKRGSITCRTDRANEAKKVFINIWLC